MESQGSFGAGDMLEMPLRRRRVGCLAREGRSFDDPRPSRPKGEEEEDG